MADESLLLLLHQQQEALRRVIDINDTIVAHATPKTRVELGTPAVAPDPPQAHGQQCLAAPLLGTRAGQELSLATLPSGFGVGHLRSRAASIRERSRAAANKLEALIHAARIAGPTYRYETHFIPAQASLRNEHGRSDLASIDGRDADNGDPVKKPAALFGAPKSIIPNKANIKELIDAKIHQPEYDVECLYRDSGCAPWLARSSRFKNITMSMILFSTVWIWFDTDYNKPDVEGGWPPWVFVFVDNFMCVFFLFEILVRLTAFQIKRHAFEDAWFLFDFFLVSLMIWETWITGLIASVLTEDASASSSTAQMSGTFRILRILRLTRVLRMSRTFRQIPELMILVKGMVMAIRSVCTTLVLLFLVTYTFAVVFTQLIAEDSETDLAKTFPQVPTSLNFLILQTLCGWDADFFHTMLQYSWLCYFLLLLYLLLGTLTIMNMLVGILVEVVSVSASQEEEEQSLTSLKREIQAIILAGDQDGDGTVTSDEFANMLSNEEDVLKLHEEGVNVPALVNFADFVFRDVDELSLKEFVHNILEFRAGHAASSSDIVNLRVDMFSELARIRNEIGNSVGDQLEDHRNNTPKGRGHGLQGGVPHIGTHQIGAP